MNNDFYLIQLGQIVKSLRTEQNLKQIELCERLQCDRRFLQRLENGKCSPTFKTIEKVSTGLGVPISKLLTFEKIFVPDVKFLSEKIDYSKCHSQNGIGFRDKNGVILRVNKAYEEITGLKEQDVCGLSVFDLVTDEGRVILQKQLSDESSGKNSNYKTILKSKSGDVPMKISPVPCFSFDSEHIGTITFMTRRTSKDIDVQTELIPVLKFLVKR